jgi:rhodanese-related sulfurtransferase
MKRVVLCVAFLSLAVVSTVFVAGVAAAQQDVPRMTKEELKPLIGDPNVVVIDVRAPGDWEKDTLMIKGAIREDPMGVPSWIDKYPKDKTFVFYCS